MTIPNTMDQEARLAFLRNSRRRVMDGNEDLENANDLDFDVSGTAGPQKPKPNTPAAEMGGELNAQSYDVRANTAQQPSENESPFTKLGRYIGNALTKNALPQEIEDAKGYASNLMGGHIIGDSISKYWPSQADAQAVNPSPMAPDVQADDIPQDSNALQRFGQWIKDGWTPNPEKIRENASKMPPADLLSVPPIVKSLFGVAGQSFLPDTFGDVQKQQEWKEYRENQAMRAQGLDPTTTREQKQQQLESATQEAMNNPWQSSVYGAAEVVASHPALQEEFKKITGVDYEPQLAQQISDYEVAMKGVEDSLNGIQTSLTEQENQIKERILNNQSTDADMYYIGLALLMPLLVGGFLGKEAGLGALAGGTQGVADVLTRRQKDIRDDESSLLDIARQKSSNEEKLASMALEGSQLGSKLRKALPDDPREHLVGRREVQWVNPETNEIESAVEILPGLVADNTFVGNKEGLASRVRSAEELSGVMSYVDELDDITNDIIKIASQLDDQSAIPKMWNAYLAGKVPGSLSKTTQDVELDGRRVNAGIVLEEKLGLLANAYAQAKNVGQLDRAAQAHMAKLFTNPTASLTSPKDTIDQMLEIRKLAQRGILKEAKGKGFIPEFLQNEYDKKNQDLFNYLNKLERDKKFANLKKDASRQGTSYAQ